MNRTVILVDIDHTVSASWPRDGMIGVSSWDEYHSASQHDVPVRDIKNLVNVLHGVGFTIIALTARPEKWRQLTMSWLVFNEVSVDEILMRPDDRWRPSPEIKLELIKKRFADVRKEVAFILEDRTDVIEAFKTLGITCLQVHGRREED